LIAVADSDGWQPGLRESYLFDRNVIAEIQRAAPEGICDIRGFDAKGKVPHFDDLLFLGGSVSRYPLEGYRERCATDIVLGTRYARGYYDDWQAGRDPVGISTHDEELAARLDPEVAARRAANYRRVLVLETQTPARACGKSHVHNLEPEDLVALTVEAAAMARVPLAGTDWVHGKT
jgi:hypothetical protein